MPHLATHVLLSSYGPPWLHFPVDDPSGPENWKQTTVGNRFIINYLNIWSNMTIFSCWLFNRYWKQRSVGRMFTFMIWSNMATFCRRWIKRFWIKKTNKSWTYIYLYSSFDPTWSWLHFVFDAPIGPDNKKDRITTDRHERDSNSQR
jgi:hypothetical protein